MVVLLIDLICCPHMLQFSNQEMALENVTIKRQCGLSRFDAWLELILEIRTIKCRLYLVSFFLFFFLG